MPPNFATLVGLPQEIKNKIYDSTLPMRVVPILFNWLISKELTKKQKRRTYHPDTNTVKKLPTLAHTFNDAKDYFHLWHEEVNIPVGTYRFTEMEPPYTVVGNNEYAAPVWFSRRTDVLSLSEMTGCPQEDLDWILGTENGPAKLLDDNRVRICFDRNFLGRTWHVLRTAPSPQEQELVAHQLLKRVAHHDEWIYVVGEGRVPLPRTPEAKRRFADGQETALVEVDDQDTIDWLFKCCEPFDNAPSPLQLTQHLRHYSESVLGWPKEIQQGEISDKLDRNRHRVEQAWLEANDCFHPRGPIAWTEDAGPLENGRFLPDKIWDLEDPTAKEFVAKMPKIKFCIRAELFHPDQWELSPGEDEAETEKAQDSTTEEEQESAAEEAHDPWFSTLSVDIDGEGAISRKKTSKQQMDRRQKSRKREVQKRQNGGKKDFTTEKQLDKLQRLCLEKYNRGMCEQMMSSRYLDGAEYVSRERVWKPNAPPFWAANKNWRSVDVADVAIEFDVDVNWYLANAE